MPLNAVNGVLAGFRAPMHLKRWITGLALLPALIALIVVGKLPLALFVALVCGLALYEYLRIVSTGAHQAGRDFSVFLVLASGPGIVLVAHLNSPGLVAGAVAVCLILAGISNTLGYAAGRRVDVGRMARQILGIVYIALPLALVVLLRHGAAGAAWVFWLLFLVFVGDIGAFYAGAYFGRHALCPKVSPKKTIEGGLGGLAASILVGAVFKSLFLAELPWGRTMALMLLVGIVAPLGDLFESMLKRIGGIKDSGGILPGHGGMLDRIDALLFAIPVVYLFRVSFF